MRKTIIDLTGDGLSELIFTETDFVYIAGCKNGIFETFLEYKGTQRTPAIKEIIDLNANGIPEIITLNAERHAFFSIRILEWDGAKFISLIKNVIANETYDFIGGTAFDYTIADINNDGLMEIIATDNDQFLYENLLGVPLRTFTITIGWNGENFVIENIEPTFPKYRFQAIQDADFYVRNWKYKQALELYQQAIFDNDLEWWSAERQEYEGYNAFNSYMEDWHNGAPIALTETATPYPTMPAIKADLTEYPKLASYAYYRIMLLHIVQGNLAKAETTYNTLQEEFFHDQYGAPYAEMARDFWQAYQQNQNMTDACGAAITYAAMHPEILIPLGSDYHGWQSHTYQPADVCPFR